MNRVILVGRLTKEPELKRTSSDIPVVQFTLAVNRQFSNKSGEKQADFINCVVWRQAAENLAKYMHKGSQIGVEGQLQVRNFEDNNGVKRYVTEVVCDNIYFLESKKDGSGSSNVYNDVDLYDIPPAQNTSKKNTEFSDEDPFKDMKSSLGVSNDDLPF